MIVSTITNFTLPTIHLNGTSRMRLAGGYQEAHRKLLDFHNAFCAIEFHSRDYYVQGPDAFNQARDQRIDASTHIRELLNYLEAHIHHLGT